MNCCTSIFHGNALTLGLLAACVIATVALLCGEGKVPVPVATPLVISVKTQSYPTELSDDVLNRRIPELNLEDKPSLSEAIRRVAIATPCEISVNWRSLETAGVAQDATLNTFYGRHTNLTVLEALTHLLKDRSVTFAVQNNLILIDTADNLSRNTFTLVYNVRDIVDANLASHVHQTYREAADQLVKLIEDMVAADEWRDNGGNIASVREIMGLLVITQTTENHRRIIALLDMLRKRGDGTAMVGGPPSVRSPFERLSTQPSEASETSDQAEVRTYDINDLIAAYIRRSPPPSDDLARPPREAAVHDLMLTISSTVDPESWVEQGGSAGIMHEVMGLLVIRQSRKNQQAVLEAIQAMRNASAAKSLEQPTVVR